MELTRSLTMVCWMTSHLLTMAASDTVQFPFQTTSMLAAKNRKKIILIREFDTCPNVTQYVIMTSKSIDMVGGGRTAVSARYNITTVIKRISKVTFTLHKCPSYAETDNCEFAMRFPLIMNFCSKLQEENQIHTQFVKSTQPPLRCPIKPGIYEMKNLTYDASIFGADVDRMDKNYWLIQVKVFGDITNRLLFCVNLGSEVATVKVA